MIFADDNYLVRAGVSALLSEGDEIDLVTAVPDADAVIRAVAEHRPDAVLTDIRMPPTHTIEGIDAAKRIRADYPDIGVVVLSQYADDDYAFELLENGVGGLGYLLKERVADRDELVRALQEVARGGSALDPKVIEALLARKSHEQPSALLGLTDREREVLQQMATGRNNHTIAKTLYMSDRGVEAHRLDLPEAGPRRGRGAESPDHGRARFSRGHRLGALTRPPLYPGWMSNREASPPTNSGQSRLSPLGRGRRRVPDRGGRSRCLEAGLGARGRSRAASW